MARERFRTQFCFISPAALLDRYASVSRTHLVLPQVENPVYKAFYKRKRLEGDLIILDNGAYEMGDSIDLDSMIRSIEWYNPQVAALPDFLLQDGEKTFEACKSSLPVFVARFPQTKWMYIPQSTEEDLVSWYKWLWTGVKYLRPDWIGIPRALATHIAVGPNAWAARIDAVEQLTMRGLKTHALGLVDGSLKELEGLFWEGCCSVDNSSAIWRGVHGYHLGKEDDEIAWARHGVPVDFDWGPGARPWADSIVVDNINLILKTIGQKPL